MFITRNFLDKSHIEQQQKLLKWITFSATYASVAGSLKSIRVYN